MLSAPKLLIAGGGTGGHVFPGIAIAEAFLSLCPGGSVSFVGTDAGLEASAVPARGFEIDFVPSGQVRGRGTGGVLGLFRMAGGVVVAMGVLRRRRPDLVIGVGGYASVPVALAAAAASVPLFLQEQNAVPGRANRLLGRIARRVFAGFADAAPWFRPGRAVVTGNPVRREIVRAALLSRASGRPPAPFTVFALGGSQGARAINRLTLDLGRLVKAHGSPMRFLLQTGPAEHGLVEKAVREERLPVEPFPFSDRMEELFARCHAAVMRAGALSIAEASLFGTPCVLIPYPFAADRHQERNADAFCAGGGGVWFRQEGASAARVLEALSVWAEDPAALAKAAEGAARFSRPDAAESAVRAALAEIGRGRGDV